MAISDSKKTHDQAITPERSIYMDEAGRGSLAGPVYVGATMQHKALDKSIFQDSKTLSASQRSQIYNQIMDYTQDDYMYIGYGAIHAGYIDRHGIISAIAMASIISIYHLIRFYYYSSLRDVLEQSVRGEDHIYQISCDRYIYFLDSKYPQLQDIYTYIDMLYNLTDAETHRYIYDIVVFLRYFLHAQQKQFIFRGIIRDGNHKFGLDKILDVDIYTIVGGDAKNPMIGAASIVAKVNRDIYMSALDDIYTGRSMSSHKGYGTAAHIFQIVSRYPNITPHHRHTYITKILDQNDISVSGRDSSLHLEGQGTNIFVGANISDRDSSLYPQGRDIDIFLVDRSDYIAYFQNIIFSPKNIGDKKSLLLHICCAPDLSRPLRWLKNYFKLYLFRYNPNIHPKSEYNKRYAEFIRLFELEGGDYEIVENRYDPKEFWDAFIKHRDIIHPDLAEASRFEVLKKSGEMLEWSDRCNPCYLMRLEQAAIQATKLGIKYFTSTLLISPKKLVDKLFRYGIQSQENITNTKFFWFDFAKKDGYKRASEITKEYKLYRQNYCGCAWTIPKKGEDRSGYRGG